MPLDQFKKDFKNLTCHSDAKILQRFFKTGLGEYGEGDIFAGIKTGPCRYLAKKYLDLSWSDIGCLLRSKIHEERNIALMILVLRFKAAQKNAEENTQEKIYKFYLKNLKYINNWDLVDSSAPYITGPYLYQRDRRVLFNLAQSKSLWERRVAMLSTFYFIRQGEFQDALKIAEILLGDE